MSPRPVHTQLGKARELGNPRKRADNVHDVDSARPGLAGWITSHTSQNRCVTGNHH